MTLTLYDVQWHDAILLGVEIDRSNPGYRDVIEITMPAKWKVDRTIS